MGSPRWCRRACFHARARPVLLDRPPGGLDLASLFLLALPLQSAFAITSATPFRAQLSCQGLFPLRDITRTRPPVARAPRAPLRSVHRRSQPLDGLLRARAPRLVSSSSRLQGIVFRSGASLSAQRGALIERRCPLAVGDRALDEISRSHRPHPEASTSRLPSTQRRVLAGSVLSLTGGRSPHRVRSPPGTLRSGWGRDFLATHRSWRRRAPAFACA